MRAVNRQFGVFLTRAGVVKQSGLNRLTRYLPGYKKAWIYGPLPSPGRTGYNAPQAIPTNPTENAMNAEIRSEIIAQAEHGVVYVQNAVRNASGSGFVASPAGYIITNAHVLTDNQGRISEGAPATIRFFNQVDINGTIVAHGGKEKIDLACVLVDHIPFSTPLPIGNSNQVKVGDDIIAMGYPLVALNRNAMTVTEGIVSAKHSGPEELQISAFITHGNSGGPLIDANGNVVGVNTHGLQPDPEKDYLVPGMNYALASNLITKLFPFLHQPQQEQPEPAMSQQNSPAAVSGHIILNGRFSIAPPHRWELTPGPQANFARFQSPHSILSLSLSDLESTLQTFADLQRQTLQTQATTWQSGKVDKLIPGNNSQYPSCHFDCQGDFGDGKGIFQSRHYFSLVAGKNGKQQVLSATLTTADGSPDHKAGLRLVLSNFLSKLQPGPAA